jgi:hypothetical protein
MVLDAGLNMNSNWYKLAQPSDFADRNILNERIEALKLITVTLQKLAKLVFHTQSGSKQVFAEVLDSKSLSSYPLIQQMIEDAYTACMDSPQRASELCKSAIAQIVTRVSKLERDRTVLINKTMPNKWKGWRFDG